MRKLYAAVTDTSDIATVDVDQDYSQPTANAVVKCGSTSLSLGDDVEIDIGYTDDHAVVFNGYVLEKITTRNAGELSYTLRCRDNLWRTMAMFIASEDPQAPLKYSNITAESLVATMLDLSGISTYSLDSPGFTFAPEEPLEVHLTSAWDIINRVCWLIAWHCYDDMGTIRFLDRKPYNVAGDVSVHSFTVGDSGDILTIEPYAISSDKIRNKVVVYGKEGVYASASASSPFLPADFYKAEVLSAPDLVDNNTMAQDIADYNLDLMNRLEKSATVTVLGTPAVSARKVVTFTEAKTGISADWFVYGCKHRLSDSYMISMTLTQRQTS